MKDLYIESVFIGVLLSVGAYEAGVLLKKKLTIY